MSINSNRMVHSLVLDTGPLIKNDLSISTFREQAEVLVTIPQVLEEIRDRNTKARLESSLLPFLTIRSPQQKSVKVIQDFARRTGDLESLSQPDILLIALTYEIECERNHGDWRLRTLPGQKRLNGVLPASLINMSSKVDVTKSEFKEEKYPMLESCPKDYRQEQTRSDEIFEDLESIEMQNTLKNLNLSDENYHLSSRDSSVALRGNTGSVIAKSYPPLKDLSSSDGESSDEGWIKSSNLKKHQARNSNILTLPRNSAKFMQVALITYDYAMQNVLLRMNLNLLSPKLQQISSIRTWVLRCHACFQITRDIARQFCGRCGKPCLLRASCSMDKDGNFKIHLKKNMQWNNRGNKYSVPKPRTGNSSGNIPCKRGKGEWGNRLILAEDQKEYTRAILAERRKNQRDLSGKDFLHGQFSVERGIIEQRPTVGAGRNINSRKRR